MDIINIILWVMALGGALSAVFLYQKQRQFEAYFRALGGGMLVIIKTLNGNRLFVHGTKHGNSIHTKQYGAYQLTGSPGEIERFYGVNAIFVHESCSMKPNEQACMALSVLDKAINDPANASIVQEATYNAGNVISKAVREDSIMAYNRLVVDEEGKPVLDEDGKKQFETVQMSFPSLINTFLTENWANILKRYIGILQNPYEIKEIINITELETIERMKKQTGLSDLMKWVLAIVILLIVAALVYKMIGSGAGEQVVNAASNAIGQKV